MWLLTATAPPTRFLRFSWSRGHLKGTGAESQLSVCVISNADEHDSRIKLGTSAVTLVTGTGVEQVTVNDVVHDLQTDGPPIILRPVVDAPAASIWSFRPVAKLPLADGTYQIFNRRTGTVLGVAANAPIAGEEFDADHADNTGTYTLNIVSIHLQVLNSSCLSLVQGQQSQSDQSNQKVRH